MSRQLRQRDPYQRPPCTGSARPTPAPRGPRPPTMQTDTATAALEPRGRARPQSVRFKRDQACCMTMTAWAIHICIKLHVPGLGRRSHINHTYKRRMLSRLLAASTHSHRTEHITVHTRTRSPRELARAHRRHTRAHGATQHTDTRLSDLALHTPRSSRLGRLIDCGIRMRRHTHCV